MGLRALMQSHVEELADEFEVDVAFLDGPVEPGVTNARAWLDEGRLAAPKIKTRRDYFAFLHEFGHFARPPLGILIYDEANAWLWALDSTRVPASPTMFVEIDGHLLGYARKLGFRSIREAAETVPELLRPVIDEVQDRIAARGT